MQATRVKRCKKSGISRSFVDQAGSNPVRMQANFGAKSLADFVVLNWKIGNRVFRKFILIEVCRIACESATESPRNGCQFLRVAGGLCPFCGGCHGQMTEGVGSRQRDQLWWSVQFLTGWRKMADADETRWKSGNRADMLRFPRTTKFREIGSVGDPPLSRVSPCRFSML